MNVLLCDDHAMFAEAIQTVLRGHGCQVVLASRPAEAVAIVAAGGIDVVVMDLGFPDADGVDGVRRIMAVDRAARVVLLTASTDVVRLRDAIAAGAVAIVSKVRPVVEIVRVVERVHSGEIVLAGELVKDALRQSRRDDPRQLADFLTGREREVLVRLVHGEGTRQIATEMGIAYSTARTHIQSVLDKLGVHSRLEASAFAVRHRLVDASDAAAT